MTTAAAPPTGESIDTYQLRLPGYEGPLDVLLRLIERNQLEITDVSLVAVTAQFLDYARALTEAPDQVVASFAIVGTRLAVLKSRSLLPQIRVSEGDDGPSDLTRQLLEYQLAREASAFLSSRASRDIRSYQRTAQAPVDPVLKRSSERLGQYSPTALAQALRRRLTVVPRPAQLVPRRKLVSLRETVAHILDLTSIGRSVLFSTVVSTYHSRTEVATAFLGILVLVKRESVDVGQSGMFGEIELRRRDSSTTPEHIGERFEDG
ncbi:MAG: segregation/condensation protein A [Chloroflexota bacterium]|nr:segregation/condensation protein A [Chloroflexota bacterium]